MSAHAFLWLLPLMSIGGASYLFAHSVPQLWQRRRIKQQLGEIGRRTPSMSLSSEDSDLLLRPQGGTGVWAQLFAHFSALAPKQRQLRQAGLEWSIERYMFMRACFAVGAFVLGLLFFRTLLFGLAAGVFGAFIPAMHVRR